MGRGLFLIAAKVPDPGQVKTRLGRTIGMERAAALYSAFLVDLSNRFFANPGDDWEFDVGWAFAPADAGFARILCDIGCPPLSPAVRFVAQHGDGWDARQANLLRWGHDHGYDRTVLVGSDSPHLPLSTIREAFAALAVHDIALGRTLDGGYYLIGMRGYHDVLTGVPMSTSTVAEALTARIIDRGLMLAELPETFDVDEAADLDHLRRACAPDGAAAPVSWAALRRLGLVEAL